MTHPQKTTRTRRAPSLWPRAIICKKTQQKTQETRSTPRCIDGHHSQVVANFFGLSCTAATVCPALGCLGLHRFSRPEPHLPPTLYLCFGMSAKPRFPDILYDERTSCRLAKAQKHNKPMENHRLLCENFSRSSDRNDLLAGESAHALTPPIDCDLLFCVCFN